MERYNLLPADTYVVINKTILHDEDRKILTSLYLPVIGMEAVMLYFSFWADLDNAEIVSKDFSHQKLVSNLRMTIGEIESLEVNSNGYRVMLINNSGQDWLWSTPLKVNEFI